MNLWPFKKQSVELKVITRPSSDLRLSDWQASAKLVGSAQQVLSGDFARLMVCVLQNESPANWVMHGEATVDQRAMQQARVEGYIMALTNLQALTKFQEPKKDLEPSFEPEEMP